jgi:GntR family transcriptional regulator
MPLYHQVSSLLRQRMVSGTYPAGRQLPTEDELIAEFGVSRATIRQAMGELVASGLVSREQGRGTFVLPKATQDLGQVFRGTLADLMQETWRVTTRDVQVEHHQQIPPAHASALGLDAPLGTIVRRTRLMDGQAFAYTVNFLPPEIGKLLTADELVTGSLMHILQCKGIRLASAYQVVRAQLADVQVASSLGIAMASAVLHVSRTLFDDHQKPVEAVESWYRGDLYEYTMTLESESPAGDPHRNLA